MIGNDKTKNSGGVGMSKLDRQREDWAQAIASSPMFDHQSYLKAAELPVDYTPVQAARHYIVMGEAAGLSPNLKFDPIYYKLAHPDVAASGTTAFVHYTLYGRNEGRIATKAEAADALAVLSASPFHVGLPYRTAPDRQALSPDEQRLMSQNGFADLVPGFDPSVYKRYSDVQGHASAPLLHYIRKGYAQARVINEAGLNHRRTLFGPAIDKGYYLAQLSHEPEDVVDDWIFHGSVSDLSPNPKFSPSYYLRRYPDIKTARTDPFEHFVSYGMSEGRIGKFDPLSQILIGKCGYQPGLPTVILVIHEASETGAPLLGLHFAKVLAETHNVVIYLGRGGDILKDFEATSTHFILEQKENSDDVVAYFKKHYDLSAVIMNSVESQFLANSALKYDIPSVSLIHEFASYTFPRGRMSTTLESSDVVVVPARLIEASLQDEVFTQHGVSINNITVRPQGVLPRSTSKPKATDLTETQIRALLQLDEGDTTPIILGAGYVQMRKGVDLFIQTAEAYRRTMGKKAKFVWLGAGYNPDSDLGYSVWLKDMIERLDIKDDMIFLPHQSQIDVLMRMADVFYLSSRLDPFPNVAVDAFANGKPVVCFDKATGIVEAITDAGLVGAVAPFCDVQEAARLIDNVLSMGDVAHRNQKLVAEKFDFRAYVTDVMALVDTARQSVTDRLHMARVLKADKRFDAAFYSGAPDQSDDEAELSLKTYVARGMKGIYSHNPCPGFNENRFHVLAASPGGVGLYKAISDRTLPQQTHQTSDLDKVYVQGAADGLSKAMHIHMHYPDMAAEFCELLSECNFEGDLFVSTNSQLGRIETEYAFRNYEGGELNVIEVPNRGRDVAPFTDTFAKDLMSEKYDIVGHFHSKKSISTSAEMGDRWRKFLFGTLLGDDRNLKAIFELFKVDSRLGLVFAEERHAVGWTKNLPFAQQLAARLTPKPDLAVYPVFPVGTMFWARREAIKSIWTADDLLGELPQEPLKYDGTVLHAFERMLPSIAESNGFTWATVHRSDYTW